MLVQFNVGDRYGSGKQPLSTRERRASSEESQNRGHQILSPGVWMTNKRSHRHDTNYSTRTSIAAFPIRS